MDEIYSLKKQKHVSQNPSKVNENIEQLNNGLAEELKTKIKLLENENIFLRKERDNNKKLLNTVLDHNNGLLKHYESVYQNPYLYKPPSGTTCEGSTNIFNNSYQPIYLKKFKVKKEARNVPKTVLVLIAAKMRIT